MTTITLKPKHFIISGLIFAFGFSGYYFRDKFQLLFMNSAERTVDKALLYLKDSKVESNSDNSALFNIYYAIDVISNYSYYKIDEWKLKSKLINDRKFEVYVNGTAINGFGAKLDRRPVFIVEEENNEWVITDSYDFAVFDKIKEISIKSDMEKHKMMKDMKYKVIVEDWSFSSIYGDSIKGKGIITNNSDIAVSFVKFVIEYKDKAGNVVNTDEVYAVGGDDLLPGKRRQFEWVTVNCYKCNTASYELKFD